MRHLLNDLAACVDDGEIERAAYYFADLREAVERAMRDAPVPRVDGAITQSLSGLQLALHRGDARRASYALRQVAYLLDQHARAECAQPMRTD